MKRKTNKIFLIQTILLLFFFISYPAVALDRNSLNELEKKLDSYVKIVMSESKIPGVAIAVVTSDGSEIVKGYGSTGNNTLQNVTDKTMFQLASNSKAFTATAILRLVKEGKVKLGDSVSRYLPWYKAFYNGQPYEIQIDQLLHHTSGIPSSLITNIAADTSSEALFNTIHDISPLELLHEPGGSFHYSSINYDILGLIIQEESGLSYEDYMVEKVLRPLGLMKTVPDIYSIKFEELARGHKIGWYGVVPYDAPNYRGNTPAGYIWSNADDVSHWMKLNMGLVETDDFRDILEQLREPAQNMSSDYGYSYGAGWYIEQNESVEISHDGSNPNFSSYILMKPVEKIGVAVLTNINSPLTETIATNISSFMSGNNYALHNGMDSDPMILIDRVTTSVIIICLLLFAFLVRKSIQIFVMIRKGSRRKSLALKRVALCMVTLIGTITFMLSIYVIPDYFLDGYPWGFLMVWAPSTLTWAAISLSIVGFLFGLYVMLSSLFPKHRAKRDLGKSVSLSNGAIER